MMMSRTRSYPVRAKINARGLLYFSITAIWLLASVSTSPSTAQTSTPQQTDQSLSRSASGKQSIVRGRVIYEDTRRPLRRVGVMIYDPATGNRAARYLVAWTDGRGEFQIKNVPAGKYFVVVTAPGIIPSGPFDSEEQQKDLTSVTVDGTSNSEVIVRVKRGGAISGKVTYADGDPAINASIRVLRRTENKWVRVYVSRPFTDRIVTDERGIYRVSGLIPGEYVVGAAEDKMGVELTAREDRSGGMLNSALLTITYYAGAASVADAAVLTITAGTEARDIDMTLDDRPVRSVSGVVILKGDCRPVARARISLKRREEVSPFASEFEEHVTNADEQGRFAFDEVQDGSYTLTVTPPRNYERYDEFSPASPPDSSQKFVGKLLEVNVAGADVADLIIEVSGGRRISGTVAVDGGKPMPRNVLVYAEATESKQVQPYTPIRVKQDGTFVLEGLPSGAVFLRTSVPPDNNYYTKSVRVGKTDLFRGPLVVKEDEDITNVGIVISPDMALLSGRVLGSNRKSAQPGANFVLISADPEQLRSMSSKIIGFTNADGSFRVQGVPGEYLVFVTRPGESPYEVSLDTLRSRTPNPQRLVLQPGENSKVDIVVPGQ